MSQSIQFLGRSRFLNAQRRKEIRQLLTHLSDSHSFIIESLVYIHQTDEELLEINLSHLNHDTYTDIITFELSDKEGVIDGEIYISIDRIKENALTFGVDFWTEYVRVVSHGLLHLLGYGDKTELESKTMRDKELESILYWESLL
jgi:probable rRNA maturation factor